MGSKLSLKLDHISLWLMGRLSSTQGEGSNAPSDAHTSK
jgi:hypothetical protein